MRLSLGRFLVRLGGFIQSLSVVVMRPDDLIEFSRRHYARESSVAGWNREDIVADGLNEEEQQLLAHIPTRSGQLLLLGVGGGREAIIFAKSGYDVTGIDFIPAMVDGALQNAASQGLHIKGMVQELSSLELPDTYDVVWLSAAMYSCIPTRRRRLKMLQSVHKALKPGGYFACQFHWAPQRRSSRLKERLLKLIGWLTFGNRSYERGDMLWGNVEFIHAFTSESDLRAEFAAGGFSVLWMNCPPEGTVRGEALLQKRVD
ncbi:class I SAM-dependent methyltransferase [candidate division KSB1 bacterium]|nr:class I SAM-dependent methyltransferase [candidate division KSB1 bacterium]